MAPEYSVELSIRSGVAYWDSSVRIVGIDDMDWGEVGGSGALWYRVDGAGVTEQGSVLALTSVSKQTLQAMVL